jgi:signal transduction histidine kinase
VSDFLEYARRPRPEHAPVPLCELLADVATLASTDEIEVEADPTGFASLIGPEAAPPAGPGLPTAQADRGQLRRALLNLAKNAVQAAGAAGHRGKGAVRLSARRRGDELHLVVWNRGAEIRPETAGRLFEPFFTTREKGTGLGLAFVREIAVDHGGRVDLASANGETTFTIAIPA